jgi:hypothetical protein
MSTRSASMGDRERPLQRRDTHRFAAFDYIIRRHQNYIVISTTNKYSLRRSRPRVRTRRGVQRGPRRRARRRAGVPGRAPVVRASGRVGNRRARLVRAGHRAATPQAAGRHRRRRTRLGVAAHVRPQRVVLRVAAPKPARRPLATSFTRDSPNSPTARRRFGSASTPTRRPTWTRSTTWRTTTSRRCGSR